MRKFWGLLIICCILCSSCSSNKREKNTVINTTGIVKITDSITGIEVTDDKRIDTFCKEITDIVFEEDGEEQKVGHHIYEISYEDGNVIGIGVLQHEIVIDSSTYSTENDVNTVFAKVFE